MNRAVFLDRDGVLIEDTNCLIHAAELRILPCVPLALNRFKDLGFLLIVVTNQAVVARGLATEESVRLIHRRMEDLLRASGAPPLDGIYFCPHHPKATVPAYRTDCDCRKPKPGLLLRASAELQVDLAKSFLIGDRPSDILAGARAGCRTILVQTGRHNDPMIETSGIETTKAMPDHTCEDLLAASEWIQHSKNWA